MKMQRVDALNAQILDDTLELQEKPGKVNEKIWKKMNWTACDIIRPCLTQNLKYDINETSAKKI